MERKLTLIYSPCQVSSHGNHCQETHPTMDWDMGLASTDVSGKPCELGKLQENLELLIEVTFKCRAFQTEFPFNETFKCVLRALKLDHGPIRRLSATFAMKNCPAVCMPIVTMESLNWMKAFRRNDDGFENGCMSYHLKAPRRSIENLTPTQLYQTSMWSWQQRANSEIDLHSTFMNYRLEGSHLTTETWFYGSGENTIIISFGHHKTGFLDLSLLERDLCRVFFLGIASYVDLAQSLPELTSWDSLQINIDICDICIPVVASALNCLLNTLSYFHVFLPIDCALKSPSMYTPFSQDLTWKSTWPVGRFDIPDILYLCFAGSHILLHICVDAESVHSNPPCLTSYDRNTRRTSVTRSYCPNPDHGNILITGGLFQITHLFIVLILFLTDSFQGSFYFTLNTSCTPVF